MRQKSLADSGFEKYRKPTRKEQFLSEMDRIIPWAELAGIIEPFYPKPAGAGRRPIGVDRMLRIYFLQHWFQLSDPGAEEALYDSRALRMFVGIDLGQEPVPDESTILQFRHLMEAHDLGAQLFAHVAKYLAENGLKISRGTIVDATIISAPSSTKNKKQERDPDMRQTKKGNQWFFGMKAHIGVDSRTKLIHAVATSAANVHDSAVVGDLLHGQETRVWGDSAYRGQEAIIKAAAPRAKIFTNERAYRNRVLSPAQRVTNRRKSQVRAKVEHAFFVLKRQFGFNKVRYRGLAKNTNHLFAACALVNIVFAKKHLLRRAG